MDDWQQSVPSHLSDLADAVVADIKSKWAQMNAGPGVIESFKAFVAAVDWKDEPWLQALLAFHCVLLIVTILWRRVPVLQAAVFFISAPLVYFAERLNGLAAQHWKEFAQQNYFDRHGIFISAVLSAPLLLIMFIVLVNYLLMSASLLITMKRKELLYKARQQRKAERAATGAPQAQAGAAPRESRKDQ